AVEGDLRARLVSTSTGHRLVLDGELATHRDLDRFLTWAGGGLVQLGTDATGGGAAFEATLDLTPANEALLRDLALHPTDGRAGDRLRAIIDRSELVVQRSDVHHRESGVDVVVGEAAIEGTDLRARQTWVKPSGGGLVEVP